MPKMMLIEDDASMLVLLGTLMEMEGYQVARYHKEASAAEILETLRRERPDVALLDIHINQISGFDVIRLVRQDHELKELHILMSSGLDEREECFLAGANDFILKPFMPDELIRKVKRLVNPPN